MLDAARASGSGYHPAQAENNRQFGLAFLNAARMICRLETMSSEATGSTTMIELLAWFEENKKSVFIGIIALAALISALAIYRWNRNRAEINASVALFGVDKPSTRGEEGKGPGPQAYLDVAATYRGTSAGAQALLLGAEALFKEGKYAEAKTQFENFRHDYDEHSLAATAVFGIAAVLDAQDKTNEAFAAYQDVAARYPNSGAFGQAKLALARLYEARNEPAQALKIYEEFARSPSPTVWASEAAQRREQLIALHPDLAKTNAPAATMALPSAAGTNVVQLVPTSSPPAQTQKP
jgi:predicted negative regulator of RcsB-dependent stress response